MAFGRGWFGRGGVAGEGATPIPSAVIFPGCRDGGGRLPMPASMGQLSLIGDTAIQCMAPTTHPTDLTRGGSH
ncbi:unnamed protein product [marine sediment metagenome]|uniref:Uncharacterized protein n=1 Tax=marine sediment metagenome TaxID=412755 RepID=X1QA07_9ZZZZ